MNFSRSSIRATRILGMHIWTVSPLLGIAQKKWRVKSSGPDATGHRQIIAVSMKIPHELPSVCLHIAFGNMPFLTTSFVIDVFRKMSSSTPFCGVRA